MIGPATAEKGGRRLRIGVDVREWKSGTSTGIARILTNFLRWATAQTSHEFVLFGDQNTEARVEAPTISARFERQRNTFAWDQLELPRLLAAESVDVFLSPYYKGPLRAPCPVVVTANDLIELRYPDAASAVKRAVLPFWMKRVLRRAALVLTISEFSRRDIVATLGIDEDRIRVIPLGLEDGLRSPPTAEAVSHATETYGIPPRSVLYLGRCSPHKNVPTLIKAWANLDNDLRTAHPLVLAGGDVERFRAAASGTPGIHFPGFIADSDVAAVYGSATVFCFPSLYEGFGLPPLEAMGCGVPVIASNAASMPEVLGEAALLVDATDPSKWHDALERVLVNEELRSTLTRSGADRAAGYTWKRAAPVMVRLLEEAARTRS